MSEHRAPWVDPPATRIETRRLVLRALAPGDAAPLWALIETNRARLAPWMRLPGRAELEAGLPRVAAGFAGGGDLRYAVLSRGGELLGCAGAKLTRDALELSYWLDGAAAGAGRAVEAVAALAAQAWTRSTIGALLIRCDPRNRASARVAANLGFDEVAAGEHRLGRARGAAWSALWSAAAALPGSALAERGAIRVVAAGAPDVALALGGLGGRAHAVITADLGAEHRFDAADLLRHNAGLAIGALCQQGGRVLLRLACEPDAVRAHALRLFAHEAARLFRPARPSPARSVTVFAMYAE
jgi:RimJ/RimL family protein N-acetyltransferase